MESTIYKRYNLTLEAKDMEEAHALAELRGYELNEQEINERADDTYILTEALEAHQEEEGDE